MSDIISTVVLIRGLMFKKHGGPHLCLKGFKIFFYNVPRLYSMVWNLLLLVSSDKAIKLLKERLYSDFSDSNSNPSAQDSALKCQVFFSFSKTG